MPVSITRIVPPSASACAAGAPICAACSTRLDGVNHCHQLPEGTGRRAAEPRTTAAPALATALVLLLVGSFCLFLECLFLVEGRLAP